MFDLHKVRLPMERRGRASLEGPLHFHDGKVYFATEVFSEVTGEASHPVQIIEIHAISLGDRRHTAVSVELASRGIGLPSTWTFVDLGKRLLLFCGVWIEVTSLPSVIAELGSGPIRSDRTAARPTPLVLDGCLIYAGLASRRDTVRSLDLQTGAVNWSFEGRRGARYPASCPVFCGDLLSFFLDGVTYLVDPKSGQVASQYSFPGVDCAFSPMERDADLVFGYTSWSVGGLLCCSREGSKVRWRQRRKISGPLSYRRIFGFEGIAVFVRGETGLVGVDLDAGEVFWEVNLDAWLYTNLHIEGDRITFGTSGRDGSLSQVSATEGQRNWSARLRNGCSQFADSDRHFLVGDGEGFLRCLTKESGTEVWMVELADTIAGEIRTSDGVVAAVGANLEAEEGILALVSNVGPTL